MSAYDYPCEVCGMPTGYACIEIGTQKQVLRDQPHLRRRPPDYGAGICSLCSFPIDNPAHAGGCAKGDPSARRSYE